MATAILLVEDGAPPAALSRRGYRLLRARTAEAALARLERCTVDLVLVDARLPGLGGLDLCRRIRARSRVPILLLAAPGEEPDRLLALAAGADGHVARPLSPRVLAARVDVLVRRAGRAGDVLALGDVSLDREAREVTVDGVAVELTAKEFDLLAFFLRNRGAPLSREVLLERVWGVEYPGGTRTVDVHVGRLRRKLGRPGLIRTVRGTGYAASLP